MTRKVSIVFALLVSTLFVAGCAGKSLKVASTNLPANSSTAEYVGPAEASASTTCIGPIVIGGGKTGSIGSGFGSGQGRQGGAFAMFFGQVQSLFGGCKSKAKAAAKYNAIESVPNADMMMAPRVEQNWKSFLVFGKATAKISGDAYEVQHQ